MKKITLLVGLVAFLSFNVFAFDEKVLCNFDDVKPASYGEVKGAMHEDVDNPFIDDDNATDICGQFYSVDHDLDPADDTKGPERQWTANTAIPIAPLEIPATGTYYIHVLVNCWTKPDIAVTFENVQAKPINRPMSPYDIELADYWQDMVIKVPASLGGTTVDTLNFFGDMKWESKIDGKAAFVTGEFTPTLFDEIIINDSPLSRFSDVEIPETLDLAVSDMEDGQLVWASQFGAIASVEDNPDMTGINTTSKVLMLADEETTAYALVDYATTDLVLPKKDCYLHIMAKSVASPKLSVRMMPDNKTGMLPMDSLEPNDVWQDLVFDVTAKFSGGTSVDNIRFMLDYFGDNLNMTDSIIYIDEVVFSTDSMPRGGATALGDVESTKLSVYPSVVDNQLTVVGGSLLMLDVINLSGARVCSKVVVDNVADLSDLNAGVYFIRGKDLFGNVSLSEKIIKR